MPTSSRIVGAVVAITAASLLGTASATASPTASDTTTATDTSTATSTATATSSATAAPTTTRPGGRVVVVGRFRAGNVRGHSVFATTGGQVKVFSVLRHLVPGQGYFTVVYGNTTCDPAQALPVGPVVADSRGRATLVTTVNAPAGGLVSPGSVSVRYADDGAVGAPAGIDVDGDGITGPIDVVAVAGTPSTGLVQCDSQPRVSTRR